MDFVRLEHQSVVIFLTGEGNGPKVIHEWMLALCGDAALSEYEMKYWSKWFKWGKESTEDYPCPRRLMEMTT
jgi:hypothetical protein